MFCKNCGAKLDDDAVFCEKCGTAIKKDINSNETAPAQTISSEGATVNDVIVENTASTADNSGRKRPIAIVAAIAAVVVVAVAVVLFLKVGSSSVGISDPQAQSNFNNGAELAYDDKALYFIGLYDDDDSDTCVYSTSYTGTNKTLISDNSDISKIRIANGKILYEIFGDDTYSIGIMEKDGSNNSVIIELAKGSDDYLGDFDVSSSVLYYLYNDELRTCSMDGTDDSLLLDSVKEFVIVGNTIYYATGKSIFSYDIKKAQSIEICSSNASNLVFDDGIIYFKNDNGIYSVSSTGDAAAQRIVKDSAVGSFVVDGDNIYYIQMLDADEITELAKLIDESNYFAYALAMVGSGQIQQVPKTGGVAEPVDSNQLLSAALFVYPDGMYSKMSFFFDTLSPVEFE